LEQKRITITDVARACDCSIATVSLVLEWPRKSVGRHQETRFQNRCQPGLRAQRRRPKPAAAANEHHWVFFYPSCAQLFRNVFYAEIMESWKKQLGHAGYDLLLCGSDFTQDEARPLSLLTQKRVDAAIMLGAFHLN